MKPQESPPNLAKPGAGLPIPLRWIARFWIPFQARRSNWVTSVNRFERYSKSIEDLVRSLSANEINQRVLVDPIPGLEDSSRYWSAGMVLEHLLLAGAGFKLIIHELSHQRTPDLEVRVDKVKPPVREHGMETINEFQRFWTRFTKDIHLGTHPKSARLKHPWFGKLNAHEWMFVHALHFGVHLQQLKQIQKSLRRP